MNKLTRALPLPLLALALSAVAQAAVPHMDLEMTGAEYRAVMRARAGILSQTSGEFAPVFRAGERNLQWIDAINRARAGTGQAPLALSSAETQRGIPMTEPGRSNPTLIQQKFAATAQTAPAAYWSVVTGSEDAFPTAVPAGLTDEEFLFIARLTDRVYQDASRWTLQEPYLLQYTEMARGDIRGYYYLNQVPDLEPALRGWATLPAETQAQYKAWLLGECRNSGKTPASCASEFTRRGALAFHRQYLAVARETYENYFKLRGARSDVTWTAQAPNHFGIPFATPDATDANTSAEIQAWLKDNIEDEWRLGDWQLRLEFRPASFCGGFCESLTHVVFAAGATPHVNGLGGNEITMDANRNIQEYTSRWTIRHEYGHTLGLPDCYIEFYDPSEEVMINYQIDTTNLMCSRKGHLLPTHVEELRKAYYRYSGPNAL